MAALTTLFTACIAVVGAWIAYNQYEISQANLRLALFEKRYAVYRAAQEYVLHITQNAHVDLNSSNTFWRETSDAPFLFGHEIVQYRDRMYKNGTELYTNTIDKIPDERRQAAEERHLELVNWFVAQYEEMQVLFRPYLTFHNWREQESIVARLVSAFRSLG
ncbi:hypothetical protein [Caballeronia mineralivorans]|jgi:hypothetical protein|uniref:hypothetical protein n=1 Tax=Caballeronia mineralivorans TaxID=2010198 RepID=UPI0023F1168F|nr:hypothetical protein [Caballeronia mineralivorans]MDB5784790.1 hypothetical protein [Caballeronia mineralivorans]MEA3103966.1 hypothetical protein [Caballeronia mineralivorans]